MRTFRFVRHMEHMQFKHAHMICRKRVVAAVGMDASLSLSLDLIKLPHRKRQFNRIVPSVFYRSILGTFPSRIAAGIAASSSTDPRNRDFAQAKEEKNNEPNTPIISLRGMGE